MDERDSATSPSTGEPLLRSSPGQPSSLASLLGRATGRRGASARVRETAAMQLEERRSDWAYSRPVVALDVAWNLAFVLAAAVVLAVSARERPPTPLRLWVAGYALQCLVHVALVWSEYRRRHGPRGAGGRRRRSDSERAASDSEANDSEAEGDDAWSSHQASIAKRCESLNTVASFLWWIVGFYWVVSGGEALVQNSPRLYWLTVVFLAFDVFFAIFCVALACVIGIALCCCLPCVIAILYALAGQEGASDADIGILPRYRYVEPCKNGQKAISETGTMIPIGTSTESSSNERILLPEDAECCICLTPYEEGTELNALPCNHHFHSACIIKWLRINATCPLCKFNILKGNEAV